jgi:ATP-dependent helicase/nuclease subunit A
MKKWSDEQLKAINHNTASDGSAIVSAAAGSGKTSMLVERITRMVTDTACKIPADRIVAVTFTNDAAGELKSRLEAAISDVAADAEHPGDKEWLSQQLISLENAHICTISSFCLGLVRDYTQELGLKPDFAICEGKESAHYSERALSYALEAIYDGVSFTPDEKKALRSITGEAGDSKLGNAVLELYGEYVKQPFPERWLAERVALYDEPDEFKKVVAKDAELEIIESAKRSLGYIEECRAHSYSDSMDRRLDADEAFARSWLEGERGSLEYGNSNYGSPKDEHKAAKDAIKELRDIYIPLFKDIIVAAGLLADFDFVIGRQAPQMRALAKLFGIYESRFGALKAEANRVDFADAEHYVLRLLQNPDIAESLRESFYEIIVDEFQDSNAVQYEIFRGLSRRGRNLFFVGDVKQSIYRFRNADQRVFVSVMNDPGFTVYTLNRNFRSSVEVIDAVNDIFGSTMTAEVGGVDYNADNKLVFGLETPPSQANKAELVMTGNEAYYIAHRIKAMRDRGDYDYGDFAVLVSGLSTVEEEFSEAFEACGVPYDKQKSGDYAEIPETKTMIALLRVIDCPFGDMELLSILLSPLYNFTVGDIAHIRMNGADKTLFENLEASANHTKAAAFLGDYRRWSEYARDSGACKLVGKIYDEGVFNPLVAASGNPGKAMLNVRLLLYYARSLRNLTRDTVAGLVNALGDSGSARLDEAKFSGEAGARRVKFMTIHAAKGLEFPVCFVARTAARFVLRENYGDIITSEKTGVAMRYIIPETRTKCDTLPHNKTKQENKAAAISEEMRKLYVACTRAKEKLILTASGKAPKDSYLSWLLRTGIDVISDEAAEAENNPHGAAGQPPPSRAEIREIIAAIGQEYPREPLTRIPRRVTATQIGVQSAEFSALEDTQDEPTVYPRTPSFMGDGRLTGKKRGDAYHKLMELLDFGDADYAGQIAGLRDRFTDEEWSAIEPEKVTMFFNSPLGRRASASPRVCKEYMLCTEISLSELGYPSEYDERFGEKPFVQGIADMFFYEDGKIILVDYKTNRNTTREKLAELYGKQLEIYARAIREMTGDEVAEMWIYSFEEGEMRL